LAAVIFCKRKPDRHENLVILNSDQNEIDIDMSYNFVR